MKYAATLKFSNGFSKKQHSVRFKAHLGKPLGPVANWHLLCAVEFNHKIIHMFHGRRVLSNLIGARKKKWRGELDGLYSKRLDPFEKLRRAIFRNVTSIDLTKRRFHRPFMDLNWKSLPTQTTFSYNYSFDFSSQ